MKRLHRRPPEGEPVADCPSDFKVGGANEIVHACGSRCYCVSSRQRADRNNLRGQDDETIWFCVRRGTHSWGYPMGRNTSTRR
jgi:hypothetical protein